MSPLDALTGEHEEEDGSDHHGSAHLPPQQHGWTDDERVAVVAAAASTDLLSCQSTVQPAMSTYLDCVIWTVSPDLSALHSASSS